MAWVLNLFFLIPSLSVFFQTEFNSRLRSRASEHDALEEDISRWADPGDYPPVFPREVNICEVRPTSWALSQRFAKVGDKGNKSE